MLLQNDVLRQTLQQESLKYYESYSYNVTIYHLFLLQTTLSQPEISEALLAYEKSAKNLEDENKVIEAFEYLTMKKTYASSMLGTTITTQIMPTTLKIMDLLLCVESIADKRYQKVEEYTASCLKSPSKLIEKDHDAILDEYDEFFERIADCVSRLCLVYKGWRQIHLPMILLKYTMYYTRSVKVELKVHQLMRNIITQINQDDEF